MISLHLLDILDTGVSRFVAFVISDKFASNAGNDVVPFCLVDFDESYQVYCLISCLTHPHARLMHLMHLLLLIFASQGL
jgi:hypothetical protein